MVQARVDHYAWRTVIILSADQVEGRRDSAWLNGGHRKQMVATGEIFIAPLPLDRTATAPSKYDHKKFHNGVDLTACNRLSVTMQVRGAVPLFSDSCVLPRERGNVLEIRNRCDVFS